MTSCLMIMHAREIPECMLSLKALQIDKVWFRGFTEPELGPEIATFIEYKKYDRYIMVSDDCIVTQQALDNLISLEHAAEVVTGWCNITPGKSMVNLELTPATPRNSPYIRWRDRLPRWAVPAAKWIYLKGPAGFGMQKAVYDHFPKIDEIWKQEPLFRTYFVGWSLTSISRRIWQRYQFRFPEDQRAGHGSDRAMSDDLARGGIIALCARDSFIYHLGSMRNFIVGKVPKKVIYQPLMTEPYQA